VATKTKIHIIHMIIERRCGMEIYVVKQGDTLSGIAGQYQVKEDLLRRLNELSEAEELVVGQTIVILIPDQVYTVKEGDTLYGIADTYDISIAELYQNNPQLISEGSIYPGEELIISYRGSKAGSISVNGYAYPYINREVLKKTLPYLTYLSIFTYGFMADGSIISVDDQELINIALDYGVAPIMMLSPLDSNGVFSNELASQLLNNEEAKKRLIQNVLGALYEKGYQGVDLDFEYIFAQDKELYIGFVNDMRKALNAQGYTVNVDLAPKTSAEQSGLLYEAHDYGALGAASNYVLVMTYEWGYTYGPPMAVSPVNSVRRVLDYAVTDIETYKIFMGMNNYGYNWPLPYEKGVTAASTIGNVAAVSLARQYGSVIEYDEASQAPYFTYVDEEGIEHVVWFEDARSIQARIRLVNEYDLNGAGYWNIMKFFPQNWLILNSMYQIRKVI